MSCNHAICGPKSCSICLHFVKSCWSFDSCQNEQFLSCFVTLSLTVYHGMMWERRFNLLWVFHNPYFTPLSLNFMHLVQLFLLAPPVYYKFIQKWHCLIHVHLPKCMIAMLWHMQSNDWGWPLIHPSWQNTPIIIVINLTPSWHFLMPCLNSN